MLKLSDAHHFRKTVAGACMVLAPILFLVSAILAPSSDNDAGAILGAVADDPDRFYASTVIGIAGTVLLVPALLGLMHMLREREVALGHVGGGLALLGAIVSMLFWGVALMEWQMVRGAGDTAQMTALLDRYMETTGTSVFLFGSLAFTIGLVVLALGLARAHAVHWSIAGALALSAVVLQVAFFVGNEAAYYLVATAILLVGLGSIGRTVLTEPVEDWEHTPEHRGGFRPAASH
ncbi:MAG TPA: hypothetical protein VNB64_10410 [Solirubrobacteraceae bacterium]|nr:hypothetical protein [Solirubrobacteraceae bacterium]